MQAITRRSGSNLRAKMPDQRGRCSAGGRPGQADATFDRKREGGRGDPGFARNTPAGRGVFLHIELTPNTV